MSEWVIMNWISTWSKVCRSCQHPSFEWFYRQCYQLWVQSKYRPNTWFYSTIMLNVCNEVHARACICMLFHCSWPLFSLPIAPFQCCCLSFIHHHSHTHTHKPPEYSPKLFLQTSEIYIEIDWRCSAKRCEFVTYDEIINVKRLFTSKSSIFHAL